MSERIVEEDVIVGRKISSISDESLKTPLYSFAGQGKHDKLLQQGPPLHLFTLAERTLERWGVDLPALAPPL